VTSPYADVGNAVAQALLDGIETSLGELAIDKPAIFGQFAGASIPVADGCDGMIWTRIATQYGVDGNGTQYQQAPGNFASDTPAWLVAVELGHLYCHNVIEPDGGAIDMDEELGYAQRDGQLRMALLHAVEHTWRASLAGELAAAVLAQTIGAWAPIGPDGGYSGGLIVVNVVVSALALPNTEG
jgi:hypothetical protein